MEQKGTGAVFRAGVLAGLSAGLAMLLLTVAFRLALGSPSLQEAMADWFTRVLPATAFDFLLARLQTWAKPLMFGGLLLVTWAVAGLLGGCYSVSTRKVQVWLGYPWRSGLALSLALWLLQGLALAPIFGAGVFGRMLGGGVASFALATGVSTLVYGYVLVRLAPLLQTTRTAPRWEGPGIDRGRRDLLKKVALASAVLAGGGFVIRSLVQGVGSIQPSKVFGQKGGLPPVVTPVAQFYTVSKNIVDPEVEVRSWRLKVKQLSWMSRA